MAENGIADELYHAVIKENRLADLLMRERPIWLSSRPRISDASGAFTGRTDYYSLLRTYLHTFQCRSGTVHSAQAGKASIKPAVSRTVCSHSRTRSGRSSGTGTRSVAERKKASMSPKELQALIRETADFKKWSAQDKKLS